MAFGVLGVDRHIRESSSTTTTAATEERNSNSNSNSNNNDNNSSNSNSNSNSNSDSNNSNNSNNNNTPDGWPSCRGRGGSVASRSDLFGRLTGEARSQPGASQGLQGQRVGPTMGDAPSGVVARRTCPSGLTSFGRVTQRALC